MVATMSIGKNRSRTVHNERLTGAFETILAHGGIFIILLSAEETYTYTKGSVVYGTFRPEDERRCSVNGFLADTSRLSFEPSGGKEISLVDEGPLASILGRSIKDMHYKSTIAVPAWLDHRWLTVAENKYGRPVAGVIACERAGHILLLPQIKKFENLLPKLVSEWSAEVAPALFPYSDEARWTSKEPYELPAIIRLMADIDGIKASASKDIAGKRAEIEAEKAANSDYYVLLTGTGRELVQAVLGVLKRLGFKDVVDVDAVAKGGLREDIQILDRSPALVIDVKGVAGHPEDHECQQAEKHALMRSRDWKRSDVRALTVINSQRHLPALQRDKTAFRPEMIDNAKDTESGLITTLDLAMIVRSAERNKWSFEVVAPIFYRTGRIEPVPEHYEKLGAVVQCWTKAVGVSLLTDIRKGDRVAVRFAMEFVEFVAETLQVDQADVEIAPAGRNCGIATGLTKSIKNGMELFVVRDADFVNGDIAGKKT